ncbi:hypothetical protein BCR44DRAFT_1431898 [Catenaria anguillulae PL171]|uniref:GH18 domain-containing protein n=1 Tax=Catenaria anguillulae PL171 TaxID=765915 RepID=A0A1Y2HUP6_9FUNG|nr:hypothetical protein BCR44DRAFT_1431898 [Catenaria anguillulae PL171]
MISTATTTKPAAGTVTSAVTPVAVVRGRVLAIHIDPLRLPTSNAPLATLPMADVTHVIYAGGMLSANGELDVVSTAARDLPTLADKSGTLRRRNPNFLAILSIPIDSSPEWVRAIDTPEERARFASSAMLWLTRNNMDGLDLSLHLEKATPEHLANVTILATILRDALAALTNWQVRRLPMQLSMTATEDVLLNKLNLIKLAPLIDGLYIRPNDVSQVKQLTHLAPGASAARLAAALTKASLSTSLATATVPLLAAKFSGASGSAMVGTPTPAPPALVYLTDAACNPRAIGGLPIYDTREVAGIMYHPGSKGKEWVSMETVESARAKAEMRGVGGCIVWFGEQLVIEGGERGEVEILEAVRGGLKGNGLVA